MVSHRVALRTPELFGGGGDAPVLLERTDRRFMQNVLAELGDPARHHALAQTAVKPRADGGVRLYQPVHSVFHLAVVSAFCADAPGKPRVDPLRIESAGVVVRKIRDGNDRELGELAWVVDADGKSRWEPPEIWDPRARLAVAGGGQLDAAQMFADPDPDRRPYRSTGHELLDLRIAALKRRGSARREAITPLFPLAPDACTAAGDTLLVGLVPTATRETEQAPARELPTVEELEAGGFFPLRLTAAANGIPVPSADETITVAKVTDGSFPKRDDAQFAAYMDFVAQVVVAFDMDGTGQASKAVRDVLESIQLPIARPGKSPRYESAAVHLRKAAEVLLFGDRSASFQMPQSWSVTGAQERAFKNAALLSARSRFDSVSVDRDRFGDRGAVYVARTFVRVRRHDDCPPDLVWSQRSPEFSVSAWFESSPGPRTTIELPNPLRDGLSSIQPNVAFAVPSAISDLLNKNDPKDLLDGKGKEPSDSGLAWLCTFSIPIITICAFLLLSIIIKLLDIVFWWLPFVRICIPIPKSK